MSDAYGLPATYLHHPPVDDLHLHRYFSCSNYGYSLTPFPTQPILRMPRLVAPAPSVHGDAPLRRSGTACEAVVD